MNVHIPQGPHLLVPDHHGSLPWVLCSLRRQQGGPLRCFSTLNEVWQRILPFRALKLRVRVETDLQNTRLVLNCVEMVHTDSPAVFVSVDKSAGFSTFPSNDFKLR